MNLTNQVKKNMLNINMAPENAGDDQENESESIYTGNNQFYAETHRDSRQPMFSPLPLVASSAASSALHDECQNEIEGLREKLGVLSEKVRMQTSFIQFLVSKLQEKEINKMTVMSSRSNGSSGVELPNSWPHVGQIVVQTTANDYAASSFGASFLHTPSTTTNTTTTNNLSDNPGLIVNICYQPHEESSIADLIDMSSTRDVHEPMPAVSPQVTFEPAQLQNSATKSNLLEKSIDWYGHDGSDERHQQYLCPICTVTADVKQVSLRNRFKIFFEMFQKHFFKTKR